MDELASRIAEELGYPADLVIRAAAARAQATGTTTEGMLQQWAGGEAAAPAPAAAQADAPAVETPASPAAEEPPAGPEVEVLEPIGEEVEPEPAEPVDLEEEPAAKTAVLAGFPSWLAAAFIVIPILALSYAALVPDGPDCGVSGQLALDPVTGEAENCDGSPYGVEVANFFAIGEELYTQRCASCHGGNGAGGAGPALAGGAVLATFPAGQCVGHADWVALGSEAWPEPTYGALAKPVGGFGANMPGFGDILDEQDIAAVTLYERVFFGNQPLPESLNDCGLDEPEAVTAAP